MTYQEMRERLEILERKIEEQGATEAILLLIDDGIDTRQLLMKRKSLYEIIRPMAETLGEEKYRPTCHTEEEEALLRSVAWAQCRYDMPDSANRLLAACGPASSNAELTLTIENDTGENIIPLYDNAMAKYIVRNRLWDHQRSLKEPESQSTEQEEDEWER